jgi:hypothetical protein
MLDKRLCRVSSAEELDSEIREIFALDAIGRGDEISGSLNVYYSDESAKSASLIRALEGRGVSVVWHKQE